MSDRPTVSVIIPAYNAAATIGRAVESVLAQTCPAREIFVVDDGSADDTAAIAARYPPPVRVLRQSNGGPGAARNLGARHAQAEWLGLLDADDYWLPHKLEAELPYTADPKVAVVHSDATSGRNYVPPAHAGFDALWKHNFVWTSATLIRRSAFEAAGGFDEDRALICVEDYNLWLRLGHAGWDFVFCPEKVYWWNEESPGSLTKQVERFAAAEFANLDSLALRLALDPERVRAKRLLLCERYGRELLHERALGPARCLFFTALREAPSGRRLLWWLSTLLPPVVLDLRRRLRHNV